MARHNEIGVIGEGIAARWLLSKGYSIIDKNYRKKWGEIDIVAQRNNRIHFVEVKTVSYETKVDLDYSVSHETWRPEEKVHRTKLERFARAVQTWLAEHGGNEKIQIDVITVRLVPREKIARVKSIENIVIE